MISPTFKVHNKSSGRCRTVLKTGMVKYGGRSTYVARKIDEWMDGVIKDPNLAPNHSFSALPEIPASGPRCIEEDQRCHHRPQDSWHRAQYAHVEMWKKFDAISKMPCYPWQWHSR
jgi:hypothetical protein